ncbi:acyl-CoA dehydrogenase family protein [Azospirillum agricola]|uniref:acyl-CoA dehydrogenase family protein n=1 Tax=Azospirillum agricola TaxID=1720247 RepID=UPI000A0EEFB7|nr:acyl-CoA dehydrogenase family protein [Azospirillum agricola]SMH38065.1 acyl-CoA dehydrogenase [Azospirillum lipoferum]
MTDSMTDGILADTARRLFADRVTPEVLRLADEGHWPAGLWAAVEEMGLPLALVPEEAGGFGLGMVEALGLVRIAGSFAAPLPLADSMLAAWLLAGAGLEVPAGPLTVAPPKAAGSDAPSLTRDGDGWRLSGTARRVPWGRDAAAVVLLAEQDGRSHIVRLDSGEWRVAEAGRNIAGEPRDDLRLDLALPGRRVAPAPTGLDADSLHAMGATLRGLAMAGAVERVLDLTVQYAGERVQFGRPLGKFQAVQQNLAVLAGQAAAAGAAADGAAEAFAELAAGGACPPPVGPLPIAAAKMRCGEAAGIACSIAHQMHGAIGFTHEHALHHLTRRLWSWRDEYGNDASWARGIGHAVAAAGADGLWPLVTAA